MILGDPALILLEDTVFFVFFRGVGGSGPPVPPLDSHMRLVRPSVRYTDDHVQDPLPLSDGVFLICP